MILHSRIFRKDNLSPEKGANNLIVAHIRFELLIQEVTGIADVL